MSNAYAVIKSLMGPVFAVSVEGVRRQVFEGERIFAGEQLETGAAGAVTLELPNGEELTLGSSASWQAGTFVDDRVDQADVPTITDLEKAIADGFDPTTQLDPTAAGPGASGSGGTGGGGHSAVMLSETGERVEAVTGFATEGLSFSADAAEQDSGSIDNLAPLAVDGNDETEENTALEGRVPAARDADFITGYMLVAGPNTGSGTLTFNADGSYRFEPGNDFDNLAEGETRQVTFTYTATDSYGVTSQPATFIITVTGTNDAPVATGNYGSSLADTSTNDSFTPITGQLVASDVDSAVLVWSGSAQGRFGQLTVNADGSYQYIPDAAAVNALTSGEAPTESFTVTVTDSLGASDTRVINIALTGANDTPVAEASQLTGGSITEDDGLVTGQLSASDADANDTLTYTLAGAAPAGFTLNNDGSWTLDTSLVEYQSLAAGTNLMLNLTYVVTDAAGASSTSTLDILVAGRNDAPVANAASASGTEDDGQLAGQLVATDIDTGDSLSFTLNDAAPAGFTLNADGSWTLDTTLAEYQSLPAGKTLTLELPYTVTDAAGATSTSTVTITIEGVNDAAVLSSADAQLAETDKPLTASGTLSISDIDSPGTFVTQPGIAGQYGTFSLDAAGNWNYVAYSAFNELNEGDQLSETFEVVSADGTKTSVSITLEGTNDAPLATSGVSVDLTDTSIDDRYPDITGQLAATDADDSVLTWSGSAVGAFGTLTVNADGSYAYVVDAAAVNALSDGDVPVDSFTVTVTDPHGATATQTIAITVTGANDTPVAEASQLIDGSITEDDGQVTGQLSASDADANDTLTYKLTGNAPAGFVLNTDGSWSLDTSLVEYQSLAAGSDLTLSLNYVVTDAAGASSTSTLDILVAGRNDAPVAKAASASGTEDDGQLAGQLAATDIDTGDSLSFALNDAAPAGFTLNADGSWTLDTTLAEYQSLPAGETLTLELPYTVTDAAGATSTSTLQIAVGGVNDRPAAVNDMVTLAEDSTATGNVLTNDSDVDSGTTLSVTQFGLTALPFITFSAGQTANLGIGKLTLLANGDFTFVPAANYNGPVPSITYTLSDGSLSTTGTLNFDITAVNDAPVNATPSTQTLAEDGSKTFSLLNGNSVAVGDVDGDRLTTTLSVEHGTLTLGRFVGGVAFSGNGSGSITLSGSQAAINLALQGLKYVPAENYNGQDTLTIGTTDGKLSDSDSVTLVITPVNDAPVAAPTSASTIEDAPVIGGQLVASDIDGDALSFKLTGGAPAGFALNSDGSWSLDPSDAAYQHLADGASMTITVPFTATDGALSSNSTLTITITGVNDKPVITEAVAVASEGDGVIHGELIATDADDDAALTYTTSKNVAGLTLDREGSWSFDSSDATYDYLKMGEELVIVVPVTVTDEHNASSESTLTITLTGTNDAPVANAVTASGNEDQGARIPVSLSGSDVDGTVEGFTIGSLPDHGTLYASAKGGTALQVGDLVTGSVYFVPAKDWNGSTTFEYSAVDNHGASSASTATATINVAAVNDRPVGVNDSVTLNEDSVANGNVLGNDRDVDGDSLVVTRFSLTNLPFVSANAGETLNLLGTGKLTILANGDYTFVPADHYNGPVPSVTYTLSDGSLKDVATLTFEINPVNDVPVNNLPSAQTLTEDGDKTFSLFRGNSLTVSDIDGGNLTTTLTVEHGVLTLGPLTGGVTFSGNGSGSITLSGSQTSINAALQGLTYTPAANYNGQDTLIIETSDGSLSDKDSVTLNISPVNDAPVATSTTASAVEDAPAIGGKLAATDVDGDTLSFALVKPAPAGFVLDSEGTWTFDPSDAAYQKLAEGETLVISVPFTATDGSLSSSNTLTLTVTGVNDAPVVSGAITVGTDENAAPQTIDLLAKASDSDESDALSVTGLKETSGNDARGVSFDAASGSLTLDPNAYNYLAVNESVTLTYEYQVIDDKGGLVNSSATITIEGRNDAPAITTAIEVTSHEDARAFTIDLLANASDVDLSDALDISNLKLVGTGDTAGVSLSGNSLQISPSAYDYLAAGEKLVLTYSYDVIDNNGGATPTTATVTIEGRNDAPLIDSTVQAGAVTERADRVSGENAGTLTASGDVGFTDADLSDNHSVSSQLISATDADDNVVAALGNLVATLADSGQGDGIGSVHWDYSVAAGALDYLGAGETITLVYRVAVTDGSAAVATRDVTITLTGSNDAPLVSGTAATVTNEDASSYSLDLLQHATDEDANDVLGVSNLQLLGGGTAAGVSFDATSNSLQIDPSAYDYLAVGEKVTLNYSYDVSDGHGGVAQANASVTIEGRNDAPVVTNTSITAAEESTGTPLGIVAPTDVDASDVLTITVTGLPDVGRITLADGTAVQNGQTLTSTELQGLKYDGPADYKAGDAVGNFTYSVNDGTTSVTGTVSLGVTPVNDAPDAQNDFGSISGLKGNYYAYRDGADGGNLSNLAQVSAFIANREPNATFVATQLNYGNGVTTNLGTDGQLQKFLGSDATSLNADPANSSDAIIQLTGNLNLSAGTYQFRVTADDGFSIRIDGQIVAQYNGNQGATQREFATFQIAESGAHQIEIVYWDQGGSAQLKVELRPEGGTYSIIGGTQLSHAGDAALTTDEDTPLTIDPAVLLGNDVDVDGDTLTITSVQGAVNGSVALVDGKVVFTPAENFNGNGSFTYTVSDGKGGTDTASVTVGIKPVNDAPTSSNQTRTTIEDTPLSGKIAAGDVDGDTLSYSLLNGANHGTLTLDGATGAYTYTPAANYNGTDSFTVRVSDGKGGFTDSIVEIGITPANDAPQVTPITLPAMNEDGSLVITAAQLLNGSTDAENDTLTVVDLKVDNGQGTLTTNPDGSWTFKPTADWNGDASFSFGVSDGSVTVPNTASLVVNPVNDAPQARDDSASTSEDRSITLDVLTNDTDPDGDKLTLDHASAQHGSVSVVDGKLVYTPHANYSGSDRISYTVVDGHGGTGNATVDVTVTAVADTPILIKAQAADQPVATGLLHQSWSGLNLGSGGNGANPGTLKSVIDAAVAPSSSPVLSDAHLDSVAAGVANKLSGLVYLEAGQSYTFSGVADDSLALVIAGTTVASATWGGNSGQFSGSYTPAQSGYYTLEIYQHNQSGPGHLDVNVQIGSGPVQDLASANLALYVSTDDLAANGMRLSELHGSDGDGYYELYGYNEGAEDTAIPLSRLNASLVDQDGSETLSVEVSQIPTGALLSDGKHSFVATDALTSVDVSTWNLANLSITPPANYSGDFSLKVTATATEADDVDKASTSLELPVTVHAVNDAPTISASSARVSEEGLPGGRTDSTGVSDTTNATVFSGKMAIQDVDSNSLSVTLNVPTGTVTSGGQSITWTGAGTGQLIGYVGSASAANEAIRVSINNSGNYTVTLSKPLDHSGANVEDVLQLGIGVTVSDGALSASSTLTVSVEDDMASGAIVRTLEVPVDTIVIKNLQGGWIGETFDSGTKSVERVTNNDSDNFVDAIRWGNSNGRSSYELVESATLASNAGQKISAGSLFKLADFTHVNQPVNSDIASLDKVTMTMTMDVVINGTLVNVPFTVLLDHTETPNGSNANAPSARDIVTLPSQNVTVELNGQTYSFELEGFKDNNGNIVNTIYTNENASNTFEIYGSLNTTLAMPSISGSVAGTAGADGFGSVTWGSLNNEYGTLTTSAEGGYHFVLNEKGYALIQAGGSVPAPTFSYTVRDKDGDAFNSTLTINLHADKDSEPVANDNFAQAVLSEKNSEKTEVAGISVTDSRSLFGDNDPNEESSVVTSGAMTVSGGTGTINFNAELSGSNSDHYRYALEKLSSNGATWTTGSYADLKSSNTVTDLAAGTYRLRLYVLDRSFGSGNATATLTNISLITTLFTPIIEAAAASGNVITDTNTHTGSTNAWGSVDSLGQEGAVISAVNGFNVASGGNTSIIGQYGTLSIAANGSYTYVPEADISNVGKSETFTYTLSQPDGDHDTAKLVVSIGNTAYAAPTPITGSGKLNGTSGDDVILGSNGVDTLTGHAGNDHLEGKGGNDTLYGNAGNDILIGGEGDDILFGGTGADTFVWNAGDIGKDVIKDFNAAEGDKIDLSGLLADMDGSSSLDAYLRVDASTSTLQISTTGQFGQGAEADVTIALQNGGSAVNLSSYGVDSTAIINSLIAGADPIVKVDH